MSRALPPKSWNSLMNQRPAAWSYKTMGSPSPLALNCAQRKLSELRLKTLLPSRSKTRIYVPPLALVSWMKCLGLTSHAGSGGETPPASGRSVPSMTTWGSISRLAPRRGRAARGSCPLGKATSAKSLGQRMAPVKLGISLGTSWRSLDLAVRVRSNALAACISRRLWLLPRNSICAAAAG